MSLANSRGPGWTRDLVARSEERLRGVNPIRRFLASLFRRPPSPENSPAAGAAKRLGADDLTP